MIKLGEYRIKRRDDRNLVLTKEQELQINSTTVALKMNKGIGHRYIKHVFIGYYSDLAKALSAIIIEVGKDAVEAETLHGAVLFMDNKIKELVSAFENETI